MKNSNIILRVILLFLSLQITMNYTNVYTQSQWEQTTIQGITNSYIVDVDFINSNTGFIACKVHSVIDSMIIYKTTDKGFTFSEFWSTINYDPEFAMSFNNSDTGFVFYGDDVYKIWGNYNQSLVINNSWVPSKHRIKIFENGIGYCLYGTKPSSNGNCYVKIYKTINFGSSWSIVYDARYDGDEAILSDFDILQSHPDSVIVVGQIKGLDGFHPNSRSAIRITSSNGFSNTHFTSISNINDSIAFDFVNFLPNGESRILANDGIYNQSLTKIYSITEAATFKTQYGFRFINNNLGLVALNSGDLIQTTNGGYNWSVVSSIGYGVTTSSQISSIGEIAYYGNATSRTLFTRKLSTNLNTYFDNQSTSSSIFFDGTEYLSPSTQYLRGGNSIVYSNLPNIINPNQNDEKKFYKWSNGNMDFSNHNYYFDMSGTTIANYYKTKQLASSPLVISNKSQVYSLKDTLNGINQIYESMGGMFFSKSYNNGNTFKQEEIANYSESNSDGNSNKNPSIYEVRDNTQYGRPVTILDRNKNVVACWERFNQITGKTEIKISGRNYTFTPPDTVFQWSRWNLSGDDIFTSFNSYSNFNSYPKVFAIALSPFSNLGELNTYFLIVPHLRPASNGVKVQVTARSTLNKYSEFSIDSGDVADLSVINIANQHGYIELYLAYKKSSQIIYRKIYLEDDYTLPIIMINMEGPVNISSGDGYSSRSKPDISLMNGVPIVSYAANYNANILVEYEEGGTDIIPLHRYPIVKVQRIDTSHWGNYIIYNSAKVQDNPDIEGSNDTKSYLLNYSIGNGKFKKVVNVF